MSKYPEKRDDKPAGLSDIFPKPPSVPADIATKYRLYPTADQETLLAHGRISPVSRTGSLLSRSAAPYVSVGNGKLYIPKFRPGIRIVLHRPVEGEIRSATVSKNAAGAYHVSILTETGTGVKPRAPVTRDRAVG
jgi:hypothetical protein